MALKFYPQFFDSLEAVLDDVKANGTWPTTYVSGPSEGASVHWHAEDVHAYIMEGDTDFFDAETGERTPVTVGDKIVVPARALHAEGAVADRVTYILALPLPLTPDKFLAPHEPEDPG